MKLKVIGKATALSKKEAKQAVKFFTSLLLNERKSKNLTITVSFVDNGKRTPRGLCYWLDNNFKPNEFEIVISSSFGRRTQLISLAHEMVHVKQFTKGELFDYLSAKKLDYSKFRQIEYNINKIDYWDHPWEIEAYGRELGLYERYKNFLLNK